MELSPSALGFLSVSISSLFLFFALFLSHCKQLVPGHYYTNRQTDRQTDGRTVATDGRVGAAVVDGRTDGQTDRRGRQTERGRAQQDETSPLRPGPIARRPTDRPTLTSLYLLPSFIPDHSFRPFLAAASPARLGRPDPSPPPRAPRPPRLRP